MKNYYKIQEISRLYGICADTIRYYEEQGLIHPKRSPHNYRLFSIRDIGNLNIIRSMRSLGLSTEQIRAYIHERTVSSTLELYEKEQNLIRKKIEELQNQYEDICRCQKDLERALTLPLEKPRLLFLEKRPCFVLEGEALPGDDIDFLLKKLKQRHEDVIKIIGSTDIGASFELDCALKGDFSHAKGVFFMGTDQYKDTDIPSGAYGSIAYGGDYQRLKDAFASLLDFLRKKGYEPAGNPFEIYHVDMQETNDRKEYITELQILCRPENYCNYK